MPRKTRYEIEAETTPAAPGTEAYWRAKRTEASAKRQMLEAQHRKMMIDKMNHDLIPREEVDEVFARAFAAYRQAAKEVGRRYGPDALALLTNAVRSGLRVQAEEEQNWNRPQPQTSKDGPESKPKPKGRSPGSRKKKS